MCATIFGRDSSSNLLAGNVSLEILCFFGGGKYFWLQFFFRCLVGVFLRVFWKVFFQIYIFGIFFCGSLSADIFGIFLVDISFEIQYFLVL